MRVESVQVNLTPSSQAEAAQIFSGLKSGDTIQAELAGISGSRIAIKTPDGKIIQADFRGSAQFQPGDILELMLDSRQGSRISLRLLSLNSQPVQLDVSVQENLLLRSGIEPSALNVRLSGILQKNGFLPTAQNLANLARIMQEQPKLPADTSAFLAANHLKPDEATLRQLDQLLSKFPQTGTRVQQLSEAFARLLAEFETSGQKTPGTMLAEKPLESVSQAKPFMAASSAREHAQNGVRPYAAAGPEQLIRTLASLPGLKDAYTAIKVHLADTALSGRQVQTTAGTSGSGGLEEIFKILNSMPEQEAKAVLTPLADRDPQNAKVYSAMLSFLNLPASEKQYVISVLSNLTANNPGLISGTADMPLGNPVLTAETSVQENLGGQLPTGTAAETLPGTVQSGPTGAALEAAGQLLRRLDGLFVHLNPGDVPAAAEELRQSVQNQEKMLENISADLSRLTGDKNLLSRQAGELHAQVQFTSGLEQFFYFQIPVRFESHKSTAELYIFERNAKSKNNREQSTILIALETQNLGRIETMLRCEGTSLDVNFRLNSESFSNYLKNKASDLKQALLESGFQVKNMQFGVIQTKTTLLNAQELFSKENRFPAVGLDIQI